IRTCIAQYLSVKDAISCVRVSKEWAQDFVYRVWHTVDFDVHKDFDRMDLAIVAECGHHIRVVKNLKSLSQFNALRYPSVRGIKGLQISLGGDLFDTALSCNLISRNSSSLGALSVTYPVSLWATKLDPGPAFDDYKHFGIKELHMHAKHVIGDITGDPSGWSTSSPLFTHFPNLKKWLTCISSTDSAQAISDGVELWWPKLREIDTSYSKGAIVKDVLANIYRPLTSIVFRYSEVSAELFLAVLLHQETLQNIVAHMNNSDNAQSMETGRLQEVNDHFRNSGWIIQSILRQCPKLTSFKFLGHEMDMDFVERSRWSCTGLRCLHTRIRHLDTKEKVDAAITRLISARESGTNIDPYDKSIEARVACHLLKFDKLTDIRLSS
ncbi:hypothetical protein BG011_004446, partial [Mortierella polycephala]